jgi:aryl-alcohol dehydrogenase-like predicted oxidoreductase
VKTRPLGRSTLEITPVGVGTAPLGSSPDWPIWWGSQDRTGGIGAIRRALDVGVNWIDTAPFYGWGRAEELVGEAIRGRRDRMLVFTKCGTFRDPAREDLLPESIRSDLEGSLRRLGTDYVDLLQFHDPDPRTPIEESWAELQRLVEEGKVRHGGLSNHPLEAVDRAHALAPVAAVQYQYSLLVRDVEREVLPFARHRRIGVLAWSPLASGFLTDSFELEWLDEDDFRRRHPFAERERAGEIPRLRAALEEVGARRGATAAQVALAWVLREPAVRGAIVGIRTTAEADALPAAAELELDAEDLARLDAALGETAGKNGDAFERGVELIRTAEYFAAHEELEDAWRAAPAEERDFLQGLVHVAVAWYQAGRGRRIGTERQLAKAIRRLEPYAPVHRGLELEPLLAQLRELHERGSLDLPPPRL